MCCLLTPIRSAEKNTISNYYPLESSPRPHSLPASVNRNALLVSGYVCNCSLAIHVNFVVSVGGFDVREERCSRRTRRRGFCRPASSCRHTKARDSTRRTGQLISLRLLPVLLRVRGTLWEKLATDKIGSRIIWSAAKNVTQDTLALTKDLWSKGVPASYPFGGLGQLSIPSPLRPSRNVQSSSNSTSGLWPFRFSFPGSIAVGTRPIGHHN